jgi:ubiquinol oxidase
MGKIFNNSYLLNLKPVKTTRDYGYKSKLNIERNNERIPKSFFEFAFENVKYEVFQKRYGFVSDPYKNIINKQECYDIRRRRLKLKELTLDDANIWKRENIRESVECPRLMKSMYYFICWLLDIIYKDKPIDRFWFLETIARMPYYSYVSVLQFYETIGWWETGGILKEKHQKEQLNETHHLRIMESLGGDALWWNRLLARHGAMVYYLILILLFMISPLSAYISSELLELHAVDTYDEFLESNAGILKELPITSECYTYMPYATSLYDIFREISHDEMKHALSMKYVSKLPKTPY